MRLRFVLVLVVMLIAIGNAQALYIKEKPSVTVSIAGTNHLKRGTNVITLIAYNPAEEKRIIYDNPEQAMFFKGRESLLFTAYNVSFELEGNRYIEVKTPVQKIPAIPPMKPIQLKFIVKVKDSAKAGEYELKLKVKYDIIHDVDVNFGVQQFAIPTVYNISGNYSQYGTVSNYEISQYLNELYIDYTHKELEIPVKVYVDKEDVRLEVLSVKTENFEAKGKGLVTVKVKNIGEKTGKNAFLVLITPNGFSVKANPPAMMQMPIGQTPMTPTTMPVMPTGQIPSAMMPSTSAMPPAMQSLLTSTNAVFVGDLKPGEEVEATFPVKIEVSDGGNYTFEIKAVYLDEYGNVLESKPVPFGVYVSPPPKIEIKSVESKVYVGSSGDVIVRLRIDKPLKEASVILKVNPPLSILSSEYYLGNVVPNKDYEAIFKVEALKEAVAVVYPATLIVKYKSMNEWTESDPIRIGIKVNPKLRFEIIGIPKIAQGEEKVITVKIKNLGNFTLREATARITIVDPFTSTDDTAYIGTLKPGEAKNISFKIKVDKDATPKLYGLNLEVKYKDPEGDWAISEPTKLVIEVTPAKPNFALLGGILAVVLLTAIGYALKRRH